jgi:hypothetical protein
MTVAMDVEHGQQGDFLRINLAGNAVAAGQVGEVLNPFGQDVFIVEGYLYFESPSTLASTFNIGIGATGADVSDLMSAFPMNKTAGTVWQVIGKDLASEGQLATPRGVDWGSAEYLSVTSAAQVSTGLKATLLLKCLRVGDLAQ